MTFDPNKIYITRTLSVEEGLAVYDALKTLIERDGNDKHYYYVDVDYDSKIKIDTISSIQVDWLAKKLECEQKDALISVIQYPAFYDDLYSLLYRIGINDIKRYEVMTDSSDDDSDWGYHFDESKENAIHFFKNIIKIPNFITALEYTRDSDWFLNLDDEI